ncbi:hypothetical protein UFOVP510_34 [uncultured Caudovirales phage]|uniref:Uncharacterized protein n=1 Tax=uncultured Caudovirales phage TaxID=2100421 RepID=A0A6J5MR94_9CAUD|nr:hypothetical protein UFOVP510_34 [uncultured Caudovirales phage]
MKITIKKVNLWTEEVTRACGTWKTGTIEADFRQITTLCGTPTFFRPNLDPEDEKTLCEWVVMLEADDEPGKIHVVTIYDWKTGDYPWNCRQWNTGGSAYGRALLAKVLIHIKECKPWSRGAEEPDGLTSTLDLQI